MRKILANLLIVSALFFIFPCMVDAETFTDGDKIYSIEKIEQSCDLVKDAWIQGMDSKGNYVYSNADMNIFYKVNSKNNECSIMSIQESLDFINKDYVYNYYSFNEDEFNVYKDTYKYYTETSIVKTKDTEETFDPNKEYYIPTIDGNGFQSGFITKKEDVATYYEMMYFKFPEKDTKVDGLEYYIYDEENANLRLVLDSEFKEEDMLKYRILTKVEDAESSTKFLELDRNIFTPIFDKNFYLDLINDEENGKMSILVVNNEDNKLYLYDLKGNLIKNLSDYDGIVNFNGSLIGAFLDDSFVLFNNEFNKIFESKTIQPVQILKYEDSVYYTFGIDDNGNTLFYNINEYKLLSDDNQKYTDKDLVVSFTGLKEKIKSIKVNDVELVKENYELAENGTNITLNKSYLSTLKKGNYNLTVEYTDGAVVKSTFIIENEPVNDSVQNQPINNGEEVPQTFDGIASSILISILSMMLVICSVIYLNKQKNERA